MHLLENLKQHAKPGVMAAVFEGDALSYIDLCEQSDAFAAYLKASYGDTTLPIAIVGDKQNEILSLIYGTIKSGRPYVFIPSHYPPKRIIDIVKDCSAEVVICFDLQLAEEDVPLIDLSRPYSFENTFADYYGQPVPATEYAPYNALWTIMYTSGSTGIPKGVEITGTNIMSKVRMAEALFSDFYTEESTDVLNVSSYAFSISIKTLFWETVVKGSTLHSVPRAILGNYEALFKFMLAANPHCFTATPSFLEVCLKNQEFSSAHFTRCRCIGSGGETLPKSVFQAVRERFPQIGITNGYGTTETASAPFMIVLDEHVMAATNSDVTPIGYDDGLSGRLHIVDESGNELTDNVVGELLVEGDYVSAGYHNRPELSAKVFYETSDGTRGYRTGDLMLRNKGYYFFCGRKDNLVKVGGNRVELEDVETNLRKVDIVQSCAVVPVMRDTTVAMLAAYVTLTSASGSKIATVQHIKRELSKLVQSYMVPQKIVILDTLPRNNSGKVDRARLKKDASLEERLM